MTDLSPEMQEAIRILKEDGQIGAFNAMSASNKAIIDRLDKLEEKRNEVPTPTPTPEAIPPVIPETTDPPVLDGPQPPPKNDPTPEPTEKIKRNWWDHYNA